MVIKNTVKAYNPMNHNSFMEFKKKYPQYSDEIKSIVEFKRLISLVHERAILELKENGYGVIFPETNYVLFINNKGKSDKKAIDFNASKKAGVRIYHNNLETDQNTMKITFLTKMLPSSVLNSEMYNYYPSTQLKRRCSKFFRENYKNFIQYIKKGKGYGTTNY